jgi:alpha-L-fucosidase
VAVAYMFIPMTHRTIIPLLVLLSLGCQPASRKESGSGTGKVVPSPGQYAYQQMETVGFIHFTVNTFTDKEWGYGDEDPALFNPTELDAEQWARVAREGGLKELILTAKHHDGFCLWPSAWTEHSVKNSPYRNGNGDIVREFVDACRKYGLKVGLYLSPWDRNHPDYGRPAYITYYRNQLKELLTGYGEINEIWFDGANGGDGYYGGAYETRRIDRKTYYDWEHTFALVKELQPGIKIFSDAGPDIRWVGNEKGFAGETFWSAISDRDLVIGASDPEYLNRGDPQGNRWIVGQCDVSIRPGWFYHAREDSLVKSPRELVDIYYKSVGRNAVLLLNLPPDRRGLIHEADADSLRAFRHILDRTFAADLAVGASVQVGSKSRGAGNHRASFITDADPGTYWIARHADMPVEILIKLGGKKSFDRIMLSEPIRIGQRISAFRMEARSPSGNWTEVARGTTIGYKRILRTGPVTTSELKLVIEDALYAPAISHMGLYLSPPVE